MATIDRLFWGVSLLVATAILAALAVARRRHRRSREANAEEWILVDDLTQAVSSGLPHEAGEFNIPPPRNAS